MVSILKNNKVSKGILVFTMDEKHFFNYVFINFIFKKEIEILKNKFFLFMHWGWYGKNQNDINYIDLHLAGTGTLNFLNKKNNKIVNFCNRNFIDKVFKKKKCNKIYDIITILRPVYFKKIKELFLAAKKLFELGYNYKFLIIFPMPKEDLFYNKSYYYKELIEDYENLIKKFNNPYVTLLPIHTFDFKYYLPKNEICNYLNLSKVFVLPVEMEGASRVIHEALLCGLPIVYNNKLRGGGADYLDKTNSISFNNDQNIYKSLIYALKNYKKFNFNVKKIEQLCSENYQLPRFKKFLKLFYYQNNEKFSDDNNLNNLDRRLDSHEISLPKNLRKEATNHLKNFKSFYIFICNISGQKINFSKIILIILFERIFLILRNIKRFFFGYKNITNLN